MLATHNAENIRPPHIFVKCVFETNSASVEVARSLSENRDSKPHACPVKKPRNLIEFGWRANACSANGRHSRPTKIRFRDTFPSTPSTKRGARLMHSHINTIKCENFKMVLPLLHSVIVSAHLATQNYNISTINCVYAKN